MFVHYWPCVVHKGRKTEEIAYGFMRISKLAQPGNSCLFCRKDMSTKRLSTKTRRSSLHSIH